LSDEKPAALGGLRLLEITQGMSGSICGRLLSELGAEVIKIESPVGDSIRNLPPFKLDKISYAFESVSVNKKSVVLDLRKSEGKLILKRLIKGADIFIEDYPVGSMDNLEIGYGVLKKVNLKLIYCSITPFGQNSPLRNKESSDIIVQAMSGVMATTGFLQDPPTKAGFPISEFISSIYAVIGILTALHYREESGKGQAIDISMVDCLLSYFTTYLPTLFMTGKVPPKRGNRHTTISPWNSYEAKDGWVFICTGNNDEWNRILEVMEYDYLIHDQRFDTNEKRVKIEEEVDAMLNKWTKKHTVEDIIKILEGAKISVGPIFAIDQLLTDPHFLYRRMVTEVDHPSAGKIPVVGSMFKMSETPGVIKTAAPLLGQHTEEVLIDLLGYTRKDIQDLRTKEVI